MKKIIERKIYSKSSMGPINIKRIPKKYREDVAKLYLFLSTLSGYANDKDTGPAKFKYFVRKWQALKKDNAFGYYVRTDDSINEVALSNIAYLVHRYELPTKEIDNFIRAVAIDMRSKSLHSSHDFLRYLQYSGESPALLLAKILELPNAVTHHAKMHGRSLKILHLVRSFSKDTSTGRCYFPTQELNKLGLQNLEKKTITDNPKAFNDFVFLQIKRYEAWQEEAKKGDIFLPKKVRLISRRLRIENGILVESITKSPLTLLNSSHNISRTHLLRASVKSMIKK